MGCRCGANPQPDGEARIMNAVKTWTLIGSDGKPYRSDVPGTLGGHRRGKLYGLLDCRAALQAIARGSYVKNRVFFLDETTAVRAGYRPCAVCLPEKHAEWKTMTAAKKPHSRVIAIQRAYEEATPADGYRALIDRFWPRGRSKTDLRLDVWAREVAPATELIHWFGHKPERWEEFRERYTEELSAPDMRERLQTLLTAAGPGRITLVYGARNELENQAVVLRDVLQAMDGG
jgi:uncharacterized protein YeaO (DUF488 family)